MCVPQREWGKDVGIPVPSSWCLIHPGTILGRAATFVEVLHLL